MAKPIKNAISYQKYLRVLCRANRSEMTYKEIRNRNILTHLVWSFVSDGFVYVAVQDLSKPYIPNENPSHYRYDVAQAIIGGK